MDKLDSDLKLLILSKIGKNIKVKYVPFGDGEQNYTIFYKKNYPYSLVNKEWHYLLDCKSKL